MHLASLALTLVSCYPFRFDGGGPDPMLPDGVFWRNQEETPQRWDQRDNERYYQLPWRRHHAYRRNWFQRWQDPDEYY